MRPMAGRTSVMLVGVGNSLIARSFSGSWCMPDSDGSWLRNVTLLAAKTHLLGLRVRLAFSSIVSTWSINNRCSDHVADAKHTSSIKHWRWIPFNPPKSEWTNFWKLAGALQSPNGIRRNWKCPSSVRKAVSGFASSVRRICQYPELTRRISSQWRSLSDVACLLMFLELWNAQIYLPYGRCK